ESSQHQEKEIRMSDLKAVQPHEAARLVREGAVLVDIREADEHARERIAGARHYSLSKIDAESPVRAGKDVLIFHCRSGMRTEANAAPLAAAVEGCNVYVLEGGLDAWKKAGLPVAIDRKQPIEIMRQVQIGAGSLVLIGVFLGALVNPLFYAQS